jgi:dihydroorotase/N-acyl-D-amino-acid deacylase
LGRVPAGQNLADLTRRRGNEPSVENAAQNALWIVEQGGCQAIFHAISEEDLQRILRHPATMIGSDGEVPVFGKDVPHPRSYKEPDTTGRCPHLCDAGGRMRSSGRAVIPT